MMPPFVFMIYLIIIAAGFILDRIVKETVGVNMDPGESIPLIQDFFHITYVQNRGAAFSMLEGHTAVLTLLPGALICAGIVFLIVKRRAYSPMLMTGVSLVCSGGIGNLADRLAAGYVTDMFDFRVFPVFNVADILVCTGCALMIIYLLADGNRNLEDEEKRQKK